MPQSLSVVRFSTDEKAALETMISADFAHRVSVEVKRALKGAAAPVAATVTGVDSDANQLQEAFGALTLAREVLEALPPGEAVTTARGDVNRALGVITDGLDLLKRP